MTRYPEDLEAERSLLSTLCAAGAEQFALCELPNIHEADFIVPSHRAVFQALRLVVKNDDPINILTIYSALERLGLVQKAGDRTGLMNILNGDEVGRPGVLIRILQGKRKQRELMSLGARITREAETEDPAAVIEMAGSELSAMAQSSDKGNAEQVDRFSDEALAQVMDKMSGRSTLGCKFHSWPRLNGLTHGFQPGQLIVLAARPGIGKTALALNWLLRAGMNGKRCIMFSLEMGKEELWNRMVSDKAGVNYRKMVQDRDMDLFHQFAEGKGEVDALPLHVSDRGKITVPEIVAQIDRLIAHHGSVDLVVIDYLQLLTSAAGGKNQTETIRIGEITRGLKLAAKDRKVPILLLSQLNREAEKRGTAGTTGKPQLSDLRDSGCIEQDADVVMFIHRQMTEAKSELVIAKHRNGPCMTLPLDFKADLTRYAEVDRETDASPFVEPTQHEYLREFEQ